MTLRRILAAVIITGIVCAAAGPLSAQEAAKGGPARERIAYIEKALVDGEKNAQIWWGLWIAAYAGLSAGQYALAGVADGYGRNETSLDQLRNDFHYRPKSTFPRKEQWVNYLVGGAKATLSLGQLLVMPFTPAYASGRLAKMPNASNEEINRKLTEAERLLELCARKETMGRAWWKHLLGIAVNGAGSVIIWQCQKGKDPWKDALISFATGMAVFEVTIWTQPMRAVRDWKSYRQKYYGEKAALVEEEIEDRWFLTASPGGFALGTTF